MTSWRLSLRTDPDEAVSKTLDIIYTLTNVIGNTVPGTIPDRSGISKLIEQLQAAVKKIPSGVNRRQLKQILKEVGNLTGICKPTDTDKQFENIFDAEVIAINKIFSIDKFSNLIDDERKKLQKGIADLERRQREAVAPVRCAGCNKMVWIAQ